MNTLIHVNTVYSLYLDIVHALTPLVRCHATANTATNCRDIYVTNILAFVNVTLFLLRDVPALYVTPRSFECLDVHCSHMQSG